MKEHLIVVNAVKDGEIQILVQPEYFEGGYIARCSCGYVSSTNPTSDKACDELNSMHETAAL